MKHATYLFIVTLTLCVFSARPISAAIGGSDNFNDNSRDVTKWNTDVVTGNGALLETNQRLEYRVASPNLSVGDEAVRAWILNLGTYTNDWEVIVEVTNTVVPTIVDQISSIGIEALNAADFQDYCYLELYSSALSHLPFRRGLKAGFAVNDTDLNDATTGRGDVTNSLTYAALRLTFNSLSKVFTAYVDHDAAVGGSQWQNLGSFGVAGSGGNITNGNWGMTASGTFYVAIYGFSQGLTITGGQIHADNFSTTTPAATTPSLTGKRVGNTLELSWPQSAVAYELESKTNLTSGVWTTVTNLVTTSGSTNSVSVTIVPPQNFFRLRR